MPTYIRDCYKQKKPVLSFEVFPPKKTDDVEGIYKALGELETLHPDFISVTYGAGGGGSVNKTAEIAARLQDKHGVTSLAHLTCITAGRERVWELLEDLEAKGVHNIMALRGDPPANPEIPISTEFSYSQDLIAEIRGRRPELCIGGACYPEAHIDCDHMADSLVHLRHKQEAGADFLVSQLFFDNDMYYRFLEQARENGITIPISAGIMPILGRKQIERMIFMCGASLPSKIIKLLHKYEDSPADLRKAGIEYTARQAVDLADHGVDGVHIYTMNQPDIARVCLEHMGRI